MSSQCLFGRIAPSRAPAEAGGCKQLCCDSPHSEGQKPDRRWFTQTATVGHVKDVKTRRNDRRKEQHADPLRSSWWPAQGGTLARYAIRCPQGKNKCQARLPFPHGPRRKGSVHPSDAGIPTVNAVAALLPV